MSESVEASTPPVDQPPPPEVQARYGGFWVRLGACLVDSLILWSAWGAIALIVYLVQGKFSGAADILLNMVMGISGFLYHGYFLSSEHMATPGKRLFGLYVTDLEGQRISFPHALGRYIASFVSAILLCIGYIMIAFSDRSQALHDRMAGTLVQRRPGRSAGGMIFVSTFVFILVFGGGIVYSLWDSTIMSVGSRAVLSDLYKAMSENKVPIQNYAKKNQAWPTTWEQVESAGGKNPMNAAEPPPKEIVKDIRLEGFGAMVADIYLGERSGTLRLAPHRVENALGWTCTASADIVRYAPEACGVMK